MTVRESVRSVGFDVIERWRREHRVHAVLDVRERGEYALGHIPGSCPLPRGLIEIRLARLVPWTDVPLVLYSNDEHRSRLAAETCVSLGYRDVYVLRGGIEGWAAEADRSPAYGVNVIGKTFGEHLSVTGKVEQLTPDEAAEVMARRDALVLDARTPSEYAKGHIPGAYNVPGGELAVAAFSARHNGAAGPIIVHCAGRTRSIVGAYLLSRAGFDDVYALRNGTMAWVMSGRELEADTRSWNVAPTAEAAREAAEFARAFSADSAATAISVAEVMRRRAAGEPVYVIDVRLDDEFAAGHIADAVLCPAGQLANAVDEQIAVRDALLVCYSNAETRARIGASLLASIGYRRVSWLTGGLAQWTAEDAPTAVGEPNRYLDELTIAASEVPTVSPAELARRRAGAGSELMILDVRRSSEYALCHIPGSTWIPRGDLERRIGKYTNPDTPIVVVSDREFRSTLAVTTLMHMGYRDVSRLGGGLSEWVRSGAPTTQGLDGADVSLAEAKEDAELTAARPKLLERNRDDMVRYLDWEERLGTALLAEERGQA